MFNCITNGQVDEKRRQVDLARQQYEEMMEEQRYK